MDLGSTMVSLRRQKRLKTCSGSSSGAAPLHGFCDKGTSLQTSTQEKPVDVHFTPSNNVNQSEEIISILRDPADTASRPSRQEKRAPSAVSGSTLRADDSALPQDIIPGGSAEVQSLVRSFCATCGIGGIEGQDPEADQDEIANCMDMAAHIFQALHAFKRYGPDLQRLREEIGNELKAEWAAKEKQLFEEAKAAAAEEILEELDAIGCIDVQKYVQWMEAGGQSRRTVITDGEQTTVPNTAHEERVGGKTHPEEQTDQQTPKSPSATPNEASLSECKYYSSSSGFSCDSDRSDSNPETPSPSPQEEIRSRRRRSARKAKSLAVGKEFQAVGVSEMGEVVDCFYS